MNIIGKIRLWRTKQRHLAEWRRLYRSNLGTARAFILDLAMHKKEMKRMQPNMMRAMALIESCTIMGIRVTLNNEDGLTIYPQETMSLKNYIAAVKWLKKHKKEERLKYLHYE